MRDNVPLDRESAGGESAKLRPMTTEQIVAIATPMAFNGAIIGVMVLWLKSKFGVEELAQR